MSNTESCKIQNDSDVDEAQSSILPRIQALESADGGEWSSQLRGQELSRLRAQYNELEDCRRNSLRKQSRDPLQLLPTELWLQCLAELLNENSMNLLPLLLVSDAWYTMLVDAAPLWTYIHVRDDLEYLEFMEEALRLSRNLPLCITIEIPINKANYEGLLEKEKHRVRELVFKRSQRSTRESSPTDVDAMDRFYDAVYELLVGFKILPRLEWITVNHAFDYYSLSMTNRPLPSTPSLRGIKFWCITDESLPILNSNSLAYLSSSSPLRSLYPLLYDIKRLKRLILTQAGEGEFEEPLHLTTGTGRCLPELEALEFYQNSSHSISPFLSVSSSSLIELHVKLSWTELSALAPLLFNLVKLQHLHLIIKPTKRDVSEWAHHYELLIPPLRQVQKLQLEQQPPVKPDEATTLTSSDTVTSEAREKDGTSVLIEGVISTLLSACRPAFAEVRNLLLVLHDGVPVQPLLDMLGSMESLRKLEFKGKLSGTRNARLSVPSLEEIVLSNESILDYIAIPNALEVYIAEPGEEKICSIESLDAPELQTLSIHPTFIPALRPKEYPKLTSIIWIDPSDGCSVFTKSFKLLTRICFDYSSPRKECNDFCELLLRYPAECRHLDTLEMRAYPEWDILLNMLRRRNFQPGKGVAQLTTIKIPGLPAPSLLEPLTELLAGKLPSNMPPLEELALSVVDDPYFDVDMPGCEDCIDSRMTCSAKLERHDKDKLEQVLAGTLTLPAKEKASQTEVRPLRGADPPLDEKLLSWFDGWSTRRTTWYTKWSLWDLHSRRKGACERHDYGELVAITGTLLAGVPYTSEVLKMLADPRRPMFPARTSQMPELVSKLSNRGAVNSTPKPAVVKPAAEVREKDLANEI